MGSDTMGDVLDVATASGLGDDGFEGAPEDGFGEGG